MTFVDIVRIAEMPQQCQTAFITVRGDTPAVTTRVVAIVE